MIEAGANPEGATPLLIAAEAGRLDVMRELLRGKADLLLSQVNPDEYTSVPLDIAA